jgi:hypothetical protein
MDVVIPAFLIVLVLFAIVAAHAGAESRDGFESSAR